MSMYYVFKINNNNNDKKALIVKIWVDIEQKIKFCLYNKEDKIVFIFFNVIRKRINVDTFNFYQMLIMLKYFS